MDRINFLSFNIRKKKIGDDGLCRRKFYYFDF